MSHARMMVERCNGGMPDYLPRPIDGGRIGVTFNAAALYLERSGVNDPIIRTLLLGAVSTIRCL